MKDLHDKAILVTSVKTDGKDMLSGFRDFLPRLFTLKHCIQ